MTTQTGRDSGVRTYRGRTLDELIPKIRAELGPDAIILREREGLTGGLNGFFAQRCVEVDAQAAPRPEPAAMTGGHPAHPEPAAVTAHPAGPETPPSRIDVYDDPEPAVPDYAPAAGSDTPDGEELTFAQRLDRARTEREAFAPAPGRAPNTAAADASEPPAATAAADASEPPAATAAAHASEPPAATAPAHASEPPAATAPAHASEPPAATAPAGALEPPAPPGSVAAPTPPVGAESLDPASAGTVARELVGHGISEAWAHELVVTAAAHLLPMSPGGSLRDAVRAGLAGAIPGAPPLPSSGAAVAFVGAAGAGKTRCVAALAAAYADHSTLAATVVSLSGGSHGNDVAALLGGREVRAEVNAGQTAVDTVARYRDGGMVVIDTVGVSPVDHAGVRALADGLKAFELDAVYLTVPATLSASAARGLLDRLSPLGPTALVITHADEIEELGIVTELAYLSGLPIAFIHGGLAIDTALSLADPARVAARLLP